LTRAVGETTVQLDIPDYGVESRLIRGPRMQSMSLNACVEIYVTQVLVAARSRIGMLVNFTSAGNRETNEIATHFRSKPFSTNNFDSLVY
jgi:hypothetical protein